MSVAIAGTTKIMAIVCDWEWEVCEPSNASHFVSFVRTRPNQSIIFQHSYFDLSKIFVIRFLHRKGDYITASNLLYRMTF